MKMKNIFLSLALLVGINCTSTNNNNNNMEDESFKEKGVYEQSFVSS